MDYSKIKKIFYILCIISILLSLKSKVFGVENSFTSLKNQIYTLPDFSGLIEENADYPVVLIYQRTNGIWLSFTKQVEYNGLQTPYFGEVPSPPSYTGYFIYFMNYERNYLLTNNTWVLSNSGLNNNTLVSLNMSDFIASNIDIKDSAGNTTYFNANISSFYAPYFDNVTEIRNGYPDGVYISRGDFSENETLYFHLLKITYTVTENNNTIYYYSPKIFALDKNSKYYYTWDKDTDNKYSYYAVSRSELGLDTNSSYLYVLSNSSESYTNSSGIIQKDVANGIYDVVESDTTGVITSQDVANDKIQNIDDTLNDNTVSSDTVTNIEDSLDFDNQNEGLNNLNNGFFSRLTSMLSNLLGYNLSEDTSVSLPLPNSSQPIVLHSKIIYDHVTGALRLIINAFWVYIFSFYMWKFINKIYIAISTGNILDTFSSSGEAITNDML